MNIDFVDIAERRRKYITQVGFISKSAMVQCTSFNKEDMGAAAVGGEEEWYHKGCDDARVLSCAASSANSLGAL